MKRIALFIALMVGVQSFAQNNAPTLVADIMVSQTTKAVTVSFENTQTSQDDDPATLQQAHSSQVQALIGFLNDYDQVTRVSYDKATARFTILGNPALDAQQMVDDMNEFLTQSSDQ